MRLDPVFTVERMMPRPLFTLTGNLLAERTLEFADWTPGRTQRARREVFHTRGKGINVSNMLNRLGTPNIALCFTGGAPGRECEAWLRARGIAFRSFPTSRPSRTGTIVWSDTRPETTFLGPDVAPDAAAVRSCAEYLAAQPDGATLALCGSFPGWDSGDFDPLRTELDRWLKRGALAADVYGPPLQWVASRPLALIKINRTEFEGLQPNADRALSLGDRLRDLTCAGSETGWVITDGPRTVTVLDTDGLVREMSPPRIREVSPTGSGDVLFACLLHALGDPSLTLPEAVAFALPHAAANAAHPGVAEFALPS